jgi:hypothetical protein
MRGIWISEDGHDIGHDNEEDIKKKLSLWIYKEKKLIKEEDEDIDEDDEHVHQIFEFI